MAVFEELGYHDLSLTIKFGVQYGLWGGSVYWLGTDILHRKYLKDIGTLALPGSFAMTKGGHGSNVRDIETTEALQECREACGGNDYLWENRFADAKADSEIFTTFEGDNTVLLQLVAKTRLGEFKESFGRIGLNGTMKFVSDIASTKINELNPIITRNVDRKHLLSRKFYTTALKPLLQLNILIPRD